MISGLKPSYFYGLDLAGDEINNPAQPFSHVFTMAKNSGLKLSIHAGEAGARRTFIRLLNSLMLHALGMA